MSKNILISGYYGFDNAGDEAVLFSIIRDLRTVLGEEANITVLSNDVAMTEERYKVKAVNRWGKRGLLETIKECDLFISGGGSLLQDVTSKNGILYYLGLIAVAKYYKKPVLIYAQGIGPINSARNRFLTAKLLNKVSDITVRDKESAAELQAMGVNKAIVVTADPVLSVGRYGADPTAGRNILSHYGFAEEKKTLAVSLRPWANEQRFVEQVAIACTQMQTEGWQLVFVPMQFKQDDRINEETAFKIKELSGEMPIVIKEQLNPAEVISLLQNADMVLAMRLHALIIGAALSKKVVGLEYDPKISAFMDSIKNPAYEPIGDVEAEVLLEYLHNDEDTEESGVNDDMIERAVYPAYLAKEILSK